MDLKGLQTGRSLFQNSTVKIKRNYMFAWRMLKFDFFHNSAQPLQFIKGTGKTWLRSQLLTYLLTDKTFMMTFLQSAIQSWHDSNTGANFYVSVFPSLCTFRKLRKLLRGDQIFSWTTFFLLLKGKHYTSFNMGHLAFPCVWWSNCYE